MQMMRTMMMLFLMATSSIADGDYIFEQSYEYQVYGGYSQSICLDGGNFNGDGQMDFIASYSEDDGGYLYVFLGNGDCTFEPIWSEYYSYPLGSITVSDFDNDGVDDLLIGEGYGDLSGTHLENADSIHVLRGDGDGSFIEESILELGNVWVTSGDLDTDGNADLVVSDAGGSGGDSVTVTFGNGDLTFGETARYGLPYDGIQHTVQIMGDMDQDGYTDLGVLSGSQVWFLYGSGYGTFEPAQIAYFSCGPHYCFLAPGDFNGNGTLGFVATGGGITGTADIVFTGGPGGYTNADTLTMGGTWLEVEDFDLDTHLDVALAGYAGGHVFPGRGDGTFPEWFSDSLLLELSVGTYAVIAEDFDLDGDLDLVFSEERGSEYITCYRNTTISTGCEDGASDVGLDQARLSVGSNPCRGVVTVRIENVCGSSDPGLLVYDLDGHLIRSFSGNGASQGHAEYSFDSSGLPAGVYLLRAGLSDHTLTEKLVIMNQ